MKSLDILLAFILFVYFGHEMILLIFTDGVDSSLMAIKDIAMSCYFLFQSANEVNEDE